MSRVREGDPGPSRGRVPKREEPAGDGGRRAAGGRRPRAEGGDAGPPEENQDSPGPTLSSKVAYYRKKGDEAPAKLMAKGLSVEVVKHMVNQVQRQVLFLHASKPGEPITMAMLKDCVREGTNMGPAKVLRQVIERVQFLLVKDFGLELREVNGARGLAYRVLSVIDERRVDELVGPRDSANAGLEEEWQLRTFAVLVMSLISTAGGQIAEEALWKHLQRLGIREIKTGARREPLDVHTHSGEALAMLKKRGFVKVVTGPDDAPVLEIGPGAREEMGGMESLTRWHDKKMDEFGLAGPVAVDNDSDDSSIEILG